MRYFTKVYQTRSFTRAADELFTSRQALRHNIRILENGLGTSLFAVKGKSMTPTAAAQTLYQSCQEVLKAFSKMEDDLSKIRQDSPVRRLGLVPGIRDLYTLDESERGHQKFAKRFKFITGSCTQLKQMLLDDRIDIAVIFSTTPDIEGFDCTCLRSGELYLVTHLNHPLAIKSSISVSDLKNIPFITQGSDFDIHNLIESQCQGKGFNLDVVCITPSTSDIISQVSANLGVSYSIVSTIHHQNTKNLAFIPFAEPRITWHMLRLSVKSNETSDREVFKLKCNW